MLLDRKKKKKKRKKVGYKEGRKERKKKRKLVYTLKGIDTLFWERNTVNYWFFWVKSSKSYCTYPGVDAGLSVGILILLKFNIKEFKSLSFSNHTTDLVYILYNDRYGSKVLMNNTPNQAYGVTIKSHELKNVYVKTWF